MKLATTTSDASGANRVSQDLAPTSLKETNKPFSGLAASRLQGLLVLCLVLKLVAMTLFSSGFENELFLPFVRHFLDYFDNPWDYFYTRSPKGDEFPYQPLMLYIVAFFCAPLKFLGGWDNELLRNFFFKLPTLLADCAIAWFLFRMPPAQWRHVIWFYFLSPIVLYACYMHSQLDLIPTAFLFASFFYLKNNKFLPAYVLYGLALATKLHVLAAFPLIVIYLYRNKKVEQVANFAIVSMAVYLLFVAPYFTSPGFQHLVMANQKQSRLLEVYATIGNLKLYLPILATFVAYGRFALYPKINTDLLDAFLALVFSLIVLLIVPAPGWYVWMTPFVSLFMIKYYRKNRQLVAPFLWLNFFYLVYFILFDKPEYVDLVFMSQPCQFKIDSETLRGFVFTLLEVGLLSNIVLCYRAGVRSNSIYKRDHAVVIGIGGDSGAGKSTVLADVKHMLSGRVVELEGDADHKWERGDEHWQTLTHLDPKANFLHRQADTILTLKRGRSAKRVEYDHSTGQFTDPHVVEPNEFVIMSGLHTFYLPKMRKLIDFKIFMDTDYALNARWKMLRDQKERGYSEEEIIKQIESRRPDSDKFIAPQKEFADLVIRYYVREENPGAASAAAGNGSTSSTAGGPSSNVSDSSVTGSGGAQSAPSSGAPSSGSLISSSGSIVSPTASSSSLEAITGANVSDATNFEDRLTLLMSLSSSISLERLVDSLQIEGIPVYWDYSEDLARQEITLYRAVDAEVLTLLADEVIVNRGEIFAGEIAWQEGFRGFVQLIVLIALSELMQEREDANVV
jgi:uridine kinase/Gpi18-like mannosyltransferase